MIESLMMRLSDAAMEMGTAFLGEVSGANFISGSGLRAMVGLTAGTSRNPSVDWLNFSLDGKIIYVAKKNIQGSISWDNLNALDIVYGGKIVTIGGRQYKVRLLKGRGDSYTTNYVSGYDIPETHGSEWNRLMYHVSGRPFANVSNTLASEGITEGDWAQYSEADLDMIIYSHCQDMVNGTNSRALRGANGVSFAHSRAPANVASNYGWRPCLELVQ